MFWVYILRCADGSYYTGHTDDLERRMGQYKAAEWYRIHRGSPSGGTCLVARNNNARRSIIGGERQIKGWSRKKKEAMMRGDWAEVSRMRALTPARRSLRPAGLPLTAYYLPVIPSPNIPCSRVIALTAKSA